MSASPRDTRHSSFRLPSPFWIFLTTVVLAAGYGGFYWRYLRTGPTYEFERTGITFRLDYERAVAQAKLWNKPVFVYFTGVNSVNTRMMEKGVLCTPAITERLKKFVCTAVFVDSVPIINRFDANRLAAQNRKLQEEWFGDVSIPAFAVIPADFDIAHDRGRRKLLGESLGWTKDETAFVRFLDEAWERWEELQRSKGVSSPVSAGE